MAFPLELPPSPSPRRARFSYAPVVGVSGWTTEQKYVFPRKEVRLFAEYPPVPEARVNKTVASVNTTANTLTSNGHLLQAGFVCSISSTATLPSPLVADTDYYVVNPATNTLQLAATKGGSAIDLTTAGSGVITLHWHRLAAWHQFFRDMGGREGTFNFDCTKYDKSVPALGVKAFTLMQDEAGWDVEKARLYGFAIEGYCIIAP